MKKMLQFIVLSCLPLWAYAEELVVIQEVSTSGKTFVINKGRKDGITNGHESIFSTSKISVRARVVEALNSFSRWKLSSYNARFPFAQGEIVTFSPHIDDIWTQLSKAQIEQQQLIKKTALEKLYKTKYDKSVAIKGFYSYTYSEAVSNAPADLNKTRVGFQLEAFKFFESNFSKNIEFGIGGRFDRETSTIENPDLSIPTSRYLLTGNVSYLFPKIGQENEKFIYTTLGAGIGWSKSTIYEEDVSGLSLVFPSFHVGLNMPRGKEFSLLFEGVAEYIISNEKFEDETELKTNIVNFKVGIGLVF